MCGIAGYFRLQRDLNTATLESIARQMSNAIAHRGPDAEGQWANPELGLAFSHRRLAIIDTSPAGAQPMISADGMGVLTYNGEIYNFQQLRNELEIERGAPAWRGHSDTEVLLAAFRHWGVAATLPKLNGMFALAYADLVQRKLYLARDRFGEKPLYVYRDQIAFAFASELKAIRTIPHFNGELSPGAITEYLAYAYVPGERCIYRRAQKILPAHYAEIDLSAPQDFRTVPYWSALHAAQSARRNLITDEAEARARLNELLLKSVKLRMLSDVPLGAFLSGGVDSSTVVAMMQTQSSAPVKTYSIGFTESGFNEADHARAVAQHLATDHTEQIITPAEAMAVIPKLPQMYDEPFADSSQIPTFLVSRLARQNVTVSLSGDAGDELFGGYNRYFQVPRVWRMLAPLPFPLRKFLASAAKKIPPAKYDAFCAALGAVIPALTRTKTPGDKIHKLAGLFDAVDEQVLYHRLHTFWPLHSLTGADDAAHQEIDALGTLTDDMMLHDTVNYLPGDILTKLDRASMAVSLESRVPLLDPDVFSFAWSLAPDLKIQGGRGKHLLREVLYQYVPQKLIDRPKMGFGLPLGDWLRGPLRNWAADLLSPTSLAAHGLLDAAGIQSCWQNHLSGARNEAHYLWIILMFQSWHAANCQSAAHKSHAA